jgi:hypothetical protein
MSLSEPLPQSRSPHWIECADAGLAAITVAI